MGTLLISKIREEYPGKSLLSSQALWASTDAGLILTKLDVVQIGSC